MYWVAISPASHLSTHAVYGFLCLLATEHGSLLHPPVPYPVEILLPLVLTETHVSRGKREPSDLFGEVFVPRVAPRLW